MWFQGTIAAWSFHYHSSSLRLLWADTAGYRLLREFHSLCGCSFVGVCRGWVTKLVPLLWGFHACGAGVLSWGELFSYGGYAFVPACLTIAGGLVGGESCTGWDRDAQGDGSVHGPGPMGRCCCQCCVRALCVAGCVRTVSLPPLVAVGRVSTGIKHWLSIALHMTNT